MIQFPPKEQVSNIYTKKTYEKGSFQHNFNIDITQK